MVQGGFAAKRHNSLIVASEGKSEEMSLFRKGMR